MIFQTDYWSFARIFFEWVANSAGVMVFITGFIALTWLGFERKRRGSFTKKKAEGGGGFDLSKFLHILSYAGVIIGILDIWAGTTGLIQDIPPSFRYRDLTANEADHFTCIFLIVVGIAVLFKPINDLPLASILGLLAGTVTAVVLALLIPDNVVEWIGDYLINPKLLIIIIFIIVSVIVAITAKFYLGLLQAISKFLSWPPIALIIMMFSFIQGICLWGLGTSIFVNLL